MPVQFCVHFLVTGFRSVGWLLHLWALRHARHGAAHTAGWPASGLRQADDTTSTGGALSLRPPPPRGVQHSTAASTRAMANGPHSTPCVPAGVTAAALQPDVVAAAQSSRRL